LHHNAVATSGGSIFIFYLAIILFFFFNGQVNVIYFNIIFFGGFLAIIYGILDDIHNLSVLKKFSTQSFIVIFILVLNKQGFFLNYLTRDIYYDFFLSYIFLLIIFNACNFIDGSDGTLLLFLLQLILFFCYFAFIKKIPISSIFFVYIIFPFLIPLFYFNIMKKVFIGESGSFFIGLFIILVFLYSLNVNILTLYHWLLMGSYFFWDITITFILKIILHKFKIFIPHKDHAYQNFIYLNKNHQLFNFIFSLFKIFLCFPVVILFDSDIISFELAFTLLSIPIIFFIIIYSPLIRNLVNARKK
jgi:UDP-N-acetylmuramyl pentapeptide phosphotransferase/UDP-N-acetylglucosamine-1-phosphate transferase